MPERSPWFHAQDEDWRLLMQQVGTSRPLAESQGPLGRTYRRFMALADALTTVRGQLSLGPDGDEARRLIDAAFAARPANSQSVPRP